MGNKNNKVNVKNMYVTINGSVPELAEFVHEICPFECKPASMTESGSEIHCLCNYDREVRVNQNVAYSDNTILKSSSDKAYNAYNEYAVISNNTGEIVAEVKFQEGPIKEVGVNGVSNEDLILMVIDRLESFQDSEYKCEENEAAIANLYGAILNLQSRTKKREQRGVEGTSNV